MANDITLSSAQRNTLLSLQQINGLSDRTQIRLATGREINGVTDGPQEFFASRALTNRAGILAGRRDDVDQGISTIQAALEGIDSLDELLDQLRGLARQTRSQTADERVETQSSYDAVVEQFKDLLADTTYQGLNLLNQDRLSALTVNFSENADSELEIRGVNINSSIAAEGGIFGANNVSTIIYSTSAGFTPPTSAGGLVGLSVGGFVALSNTNDVNSVLSELDERLAGAQERLETRANSLGNNVAILQTRLDYTDNIISNHVIGSDKIINADLNEEAANLTATGTQYQIGVQALGVSGQRVQSLLQLIR